MTFISQNFYFRIISDFYIGDFLNSRVSVHLFYKDYSDSLLARTLNSPGTNLQILEKIKFLRIFPDLQYVKTTPQSRCAETAQLISSFVLATQIYNPSSNYIQNFKLLACFCDCTGRFVSYLVGNPEDWFSPIAANIINYREHPPPDMNQNHCGHAEK